MKTVFEKNGIKLIRATLGEANRGICGSANNCYYKGTSIVWMVTIPTDEFDFLDVAQFKTKKKGIAFIKWSIENNIDLNIGDNENYFNSLITNQ